MCLFINKSKQILVESILLNGVAENTFKRNKLTALIIIIK